MTQFGETSIVKVIEGLRWQPSGILCRVVAEVY